MYKDLSSIPSINVERQARQRNFSNSPQPPAHSHIPPPPHNLPVSLRKDIELLGLWFGPSNLGDHVAGIKLRDENNKPFPDEKQGSLSSQGPLIHVAFMPSCTKDYL